MFSLWPYEKWQVTFDADGATVAQRLRNHVQRLPLGLTPSTFCGFVENRRFRIWSPLPFPGGLPLMTGTFETHNNGTTVNATIWRNPMLLIALFHAPFGTWLLSHWLMHSNWDWQIAAVLFVIFALLVLIDFRTTPPRERLLKELFVNCQTPPLP